MRATVIVIDSLGVGEMPDAHKFGDEGSNTLVHAVLGSGVKLPNLAKMGLFNINEELKDLSVNKPIASFGKLKEKTFAKDTTAGHYEMMGVLLEKPYPTFPNGFPSELIEKLEKACGINMIGNEVASGTEIIERLGQRSIDEHSVIVYTSADSVFQVACHDSVLDIENLYRVCATCRQLLDGDYQVGRVIARPFTTKDGKFVRTSQRHDYALKPPMRSYLEDMLDGGKTTIGVGKIGDIFQGVGIEVSYPVKGNIDCINKTIEVLKTDFDGFLFVNLVDTDMLYGHRNDVQGYGDALAYIDERLPEIVEQLKEDDVLIITGDHGCDPLTPSTDHSREFVPVLVYGKNIKAVDLGERLGFDLIGRSIKDYLGVDKCDDSIIIK